MLLFLVVLAVAFIVARQHLASPSLDEAEPVSANERFAVISEGEQVSLDRHVGDGWTVVEFTADW